MPNQKNKHHFMYSKKAKVSLLLALAFLLMMPKVLAKNVAIKLAHWDKLGYSVKRTGDVKLSNGMRGDYVLLNHNVSHVHAFVLWNKCPEGCDKFSKYTPATWFSTIFMENIRPGVATKLFPVETDIVKVHQQPLIVETMRARFTDGFLEPDIITRIPVVGGQMLVVLMGMPEKGMVAQYGKNNCPHFSKEFSTMKQHLSVMMEAVLPNISTEPVDTNVFNRFSRNLLRAGYQSDCWIKNLAF